MINLNVLAPNVEIRGCALKTSGTSGKEYLLVNIDDETGTRSELIDRDLSRQKYYKRGTIADLTLHIASGKYTNINIVDCKILKSAE